MSRRGKMRLPGQKALTPSLGGAEAKMDSAAANGGTGPRHVWWQMGTHGTWTGTWHTRRESGNWTGGLGCLQEPSGALRTGQVAAPHPQGPQESEPTH